MKKTKKIEYYMSLVQSVRYSNDNGGSYAFIQLLAYNREIMNCMRAMDLDERLLARAEAVSWMLNEYLGTRFTHRHRLVFDEQKYELTDIFGEIRNSLRGEGRLLVVAEAGVHAEAVAA